MSESPATPLVAFWATAAVCAVVAYAVHRLSKSAPARLPGVIAAIAALVAVLPTMLVAMQPAPSAAPGTPPHMSAAPGQTDPTPSAAPTASPALPVQR
ncbi:hypothetical protein [Streptodolium elevatio]